MSKQNKKKTECHHQWAPLLAKVGKKTTPSLVQVCLKCGEFKVGKRTIRISKSRLDMGGKPIKQLGLGSVSTDTMRRDEKTTAAGDITSGRFGMPRMPDGTDGYVLTAKGAGVDPAYAAAPGVPSGLIAMWHGLIANIPSGWVICNGNNGTPNLLGKFVEGVATAATNPGATGGATNKATDGHAHTNPSTGGPSGYLTMPKGTGSTAYYTDKAHTHPQSATGNKADSISDIRPKYYDIAFIMKT